MKSIFAFILVCVFGQAYAQRPNVDTLSIFGIKPSLQSSSVSSLSIFDTIFWNYGTGMLQTKGMMHNHQGEFRVAIQDSKIQQVSFVTLSRSTVDNEKSFNDICSAIQNNYGPPDVKNTNEIRWEGAFQFFAVRKATENNAVNIVLSQFDKK